MIRNLTIKNFQSHEDTSLDLGPLTVVVGRSSSGKSALVRALRGLSSNLTGKDYITHGQTTAQIQATTDKGVITLTKGKPEDSYVILGHGDQNPKRYTKLGGSVPEDVTDFLGVEPKDPLNFAGQFDMPYLLRASGAEVARTLGELTNVSVIFEAGREGLRRKNNFSSTLRTREGDLAALEPRLAQFEGLEDRKDLLEKAKIALQNALDVRNRVNRLDDLIATIRTASTAKRAAEQRSESVPDLGGLLELRDRLARLDNLIALLQDAAGRRRAASDKVATLTEEIVDLDESYDKVLIEAGTCPTCRQSTDGIAIHTH